MNACVTQKWIEHVIDKYKTAASGVSTVYVVLIVVFSCSDGSRWTSSHRPAGENLYDIGQYEDFLSTLSFRSNPGEKCPSIYELLHYYGHNLQ